MSDHVWRNWSSLLQQAMTINSMVVSTGLSVMLNLCQRVTCIMHTALVGQTCSNKVHLSPSSAVVASIILKSREHHFEDAQPLGDGICHILPPPVHLKWHLACLWISYHLQLLPPVIGSRWNEPQTAYPMSLIWVSHIVDTVLTGW